MYRWRKYQFANYPPRLKKYEGEHEKYWCIVTVVSCLDQKSIEILEISSLMISGDAEGEWAGQSNFRLQWFSLSSMSLEVHGI